LAHRVDGLRIWIRSSGFAAFPEQVGDIPAGPTACIEYFHSGQMFPLNLVKQVDAASAVPGQMSCRSVIVTERTML
jgi:hypothetical protein